MIKTESPASKDSNQKHQSPHEQHQMHPKDMSPSPIGSYPGMFSRHALNVPQPPTPHNMREEDLRR